MRLRRQAEQESCHNKHGHVVTLLLGAEAIRERDHVHIDDFTCRPSISTSHAGGLTHRILPMGKMAFITQEGCRWRQNMFAIEPRSHEPFIALLDLRLGLRSGTGKGRARGDWNELTIKNYVGRGQEWY